MVRDVPSRLNLQIIGTPVGHMAPMVLPWNGNGDSALCPIFPGHNILPTVAAFGLNENLTVLMKLIQYAICANARGWCNVQVNVLSLCG